MLYVYPEPRRASPSSHPLAPQVLTLRLPTVHYSRLTFFHVFTLLPTLFHGTKFQPLSFHSLPHSLHKTPGVGVSGTGFSLCSFLAPAKIHSHLRLARSVWHSSFDARHCPSMSFRHDS